MDLPKMTEVLRNIIDNVIKQNMVIEVGVSEEFEAKMKEYDEGFEFANFNLSYINDQKGNEEKQYVINIFKHYLGSDLYRKCFLPKEKEPLVVSKLEKLRVETDGEATGTEFDNTGETQKLAPSDVATKEDGQKDDQVQKAVQESEQLLHGPLMLEALLALFIDEDGYSRRFTWMKCPKDNQQGDQGFAAFCKLLPDLTPVPEVEEKPEYSRDVTNPLEDDELKQYDDDGNEIPPKPVEIEQKPYCPPENARDQEFEFKVNLVSNRHEEINVLFYHLHLAVWLRREILNNINSTCSLKLEQDMIYEILEELEMKETEVIQKYVNSLNVVKADIIFVNSY